MDILLVPVFLPLIAGFVLLFLPNKIRPLSKALTLLISAYVFVLSIQIFNRGPADYAWSVLQIGNLKLDLLLSATPLALVWLLHLTLWLGFCGVINQKYRAGCISKNGVGHQR